MAASKEVSCHVFSANDRPFNQLPGSGRLVQATDSEYLEGSLAAACARVRPGESQGRWQHPTRSATCETARAPTGVGRWVSTLGRRYDGSRWLGRCCSQNGLMHQSV